MKYREFVNIQLQNDQRKRYLWFSRQWFISAFTSFSEKLIYWQRLIQHFAHFCSLSLLPFLNEMRWIFFEIVFISLVDQFEPSQFVDFCLQNKVHTSINRTRIVQLSDWKRLNLNLLHTINCWYYSFCLDAYDCLAQQTRTMVDGERKSDISWYASCLSIFSNQNE